MTLCPKCQIRPSRRVLVPKRHAPAFCATCTAPRRPQETRGRYKTAIRSAVSRKVAQKRFYAVELGVERAYRAALDDVQRRRMAKS